jgi:DNA-binding LacI/PurR family transcriptional regulator
MATLKDVARAASVSTATVSRVLNRSAYVERETEQAVRDAVEKLGFRRDINWRRLARKTSETICFLSSGRDTFNSTLLRTLVECERIFNGAGFDLVFQTFRYSADQPSNDLRLPHLIALKGGVDGVVLVDLQHENFIGALDRLKVSYVGLGNNILAPNGRLDADMVFYDDVAAARKLVRYLFGLGHRHIAYAGKPEPWFRRRYEGYMAGIRDCGLREIAFQEAWQAGNIDYGRRAAARFLRADPLPTAVFGANDDIAAGVWNELTNRGYSIPGDFSLAGFGDREEFSILEPPLTTVAVSPERIGQELARMLLEKLDKPGTRLPSRILDCELMLRGSCAAAAEAQKV